MSSLFKISCGGLLLIIMTACSSTQVEGTWQYDGGIYNGRNQKASTEFQMQRTYSDDKYEAHLLEGKTEPQLYNSGVYAVKGDTLLITSKYSSQPSVNDNLTISYTFKIENKKMTTNGVLPNGMVVEEYWKKVK